MQQHGEEFEELLKEREAENPKFAFLRDEKVRSRPRLRYVQFARKFVNQPVWEQLPAYHFYKMLLDAGYRPPAELLADRFDDDVRLISAFS